MPKTSPTKIKFVDVKVLDISTIHISQNDARNLDFAETGVLKTEHGFLVNVGVFPVRLSYTRALVKIMKLASENDYEFVKFDSLGQEYDELEKFNW